MTRWITAVALVAFCSHPLLAQDSIQSALTLPTELPRMAIARQLEDGAIELQWRSTKSERYSLLNLGKSFNAQVANIDVFADAATTDKSASQTMHYQVQVPYVVNHEQKYSVQVPFEVDVIGDDGFAKTVTQMRREERVRIVSKTQMRTETRLRTKNIAADRIVSDPFTPIEATAIVRQRTVPLDSLLFFSPRGESVSTAIAAKQLQLRQPVVLIVEGQKLSPYLQQLVRPSTLVVRTDVTGH